jgi:eukaryotic-like serine/threonine-protein kinase
MGLVLALGVVFVTRRAPVGPKSEGAKRLVVLPFENLGNSGDAYFAQGLAGEIRGRLSAMPALQVIASTSSDQYRGTSKPLRQIAAELGVQYVLAGRVQWDKQTGSAGRVRVSPELVETTTGATLWGQSFNATMADVFQVQSEIAGSVAEALNVALRASEQGTVGSKPTEDLRAYDYYLRGNEYSKRAEASGWSLIPKEFELAGQMYARAVAADPRFALAHAKLARVHLALYQSFTDVSPDRLRKAKASAEEARRLAPDLPEAHLALGAYYAVGDADYQRALGEFELARAREPASVDLLASMANVWTLKGQFDSAATYWRHAAELDPRSPRTAQETGWTLLYTRSYPEAERYLERAAALAPDWIAPRITQGLLYLDWRGDSARTRQILRRALLDLGVQQAAQLPLHPLVHLTSDTVLAPALDRLPLEDFAGDTTFYYLWKGYWHSLRGRPALAAVYSDSARARLEPLVRTQPSDHWQHLLLAIAYTGMSRKTDAVREARRSVTIADSLGSAYGRANARFQLAIINARFGDPDAAITQLSELMRIPSQYSENFFRVYPGFAALRGNQRFERLVTGT